MHPLEKTGSIRIPKIFVVCNQKDTAPVWGYILRQQGLNVILETSVEKAFERLSTELVDMIILDLEGEMSQRRLQYRAFLEQCAVPLLLLLPAYHETEILDAYAAGIDEVVVKPISPPIFLAKIMAWIRRSLQMPSEGMQVLDADKYELDLSHRCLIDKGGRGVKLTNLEFHLLHLLMSRPGQVFTAEEIIHSIWGGFGDGDQVLLKNVVYRLRKKIEKDPTRPVLLLTWHGGYSFQG